MTTVRDRDELLDAGMAVAVYAAEAPERLAVICEHGDRTFPELNARANQLVRALRRRGLEAGDGVALLCANRPEFAEVMTAVLRAGWRATPVNWHLTGDEIAYIVENCGAKGFVADARFAGAVADAARQAPVPVQLAVAGDIDGFESYDGALAAERAVDIDDPAPGTTMLYTSGTTGRPKGVYRPPGQLPVLVRNALREGRYDGGRHRHLCTGPLYHAAPLSVSLLVPLNAGAGVVIMDGWEPEACLRLVEEHRITHSHMVPTMFHRLLALPADVRARYDVSSLVQIVHGAAPCPVEVKAAVIDWLGPVVVEYYAATEGGGTLVTSEQWLKKPGTVGRPGPGQGIQVRDEMGDVLPTGEIGFVYLKAAGGAERFEYFGDPDKTARTYDPEGAWFTLGDMGYVDDDGDVFLTGRTAELIISGGVNIYPAEVDAVLLAHPAVADVATVGVPNEEWGEEVRSVVQPKDGVDATPGLAAELMAFCRERLARYKCPRSIDFDGDLPRHDTGKIYRRLVRDRYWPAP